MLSCCLSVRGTHVFRHVKAMKADVSVKRVAACMNCLLGFC
jgi:hypothetical protein